MEAAAKVRENRVRRWAQRLGYGITKSRAQALYVDDCGLYMLREQGRQRAIVLGERFDASLEDIEAFLADAEGRLMVSPR